MNEEIVAATAASKLVPIHADLRGLLFPWIQSRQRPGSLGLRVTCTGGAPFVHGFDVFRFGYRVLSGARTKLNAFDEGIGNASGAEVKR
ncbi:hypothetical protein AB4Z46_31285 [Variovorax sp. M-6]|uniref:hypothetical protein n=1 Tax=Variovorax sp. M-6 TaxID=3233041 RepID=UPI003F9E3A1A